MSDTTTEVVVAENTATTTEAAPETPPAVVETQAAPEEAQAPLTKKEVQQRRRESRSAESESGATPVKGKDGLKRDPETGQFLPGDREEEVEEEVTLATTPEAVEATEAEPAITPGTDQTAESEGAEPVPEPNRIPIPENHPIREMGKATSLPATTPEEERMLKGLFNATHARRKDVEALQVKLDEALKENRQYKENTLRTEAISHADREWMATQDYADAVEERNEIRDTRGEGPSNTFWQGVLAARGAAREAEYQTRSEAAELERDQQIARAFEGNARARAARMPDVFRRLPQFDKILLEELQMFGTKVSLGHIPQNLTEEQYQKTFDESFNRRIMSQPEIVALRQRAAQQKKHADSLEATRAQQSKDAAAAEKQKIKESAVTEFQREAAAKRVENPPHPLSSVSSPAAAKPASTEEGPDLSKMSSNETRKHFKRSARTRGRGLHRT